MADEDMVQDNSSKVGATAATKASPTKSKDASPTKVKDTVTTSRVKVKATPTSRIKEQQKSTLKSQVMQRLVLPLLRSIRWVLCFVLDHVAYLQHYLLTHLGVFFFGGGVRSGLTGVRTAKTYSATTGHAVFITGCSTGIGKEAAMELAKQGYRVFAGVRKHADGDALRASLAAWHRKRDPHTSDDDKDEVLAAGIHPVLCDVADAHQVTMAFAEVRKVLEATGAVLVAVVNNAGVSSASPMEMVDASEAERTIQVNVYGVLRVCQAAMPLLRASKGRIITISSIAGSLATPCFGFYCVSKAAVDSMMDGMRSEIKNQGVSVSIIAPGFVLTEIMAKMQSTNDQKTLDVQDAYPLDTLRAYGPCFEAMRQISVLSKGIYEDNTVFGCIASKTDITNRAIQHALTSATPLPTYWVGLDAKILSLLVWLMPKTLLSLSMGQNIAALAKNTKKQ